MAKKVITIDFEELKREVEVLLAERRKNRLPDPITRIWKVVDAMRRYKAAVVAANAPRGFNAGSESNPTQRATLREHRLGFLEDVTPEAGIRNLKEWVMDLDCSFVVQEEPWRVENAFWEAKVWTPLFSWAQKGFSMLFDGRDGPIWPRHIPLSDLKGWEDEELMIEWELVARILDFIPEGEWPVVDLQSGNLRWNGREGTLGNRELRIINCLVEKKGRYVDDDDIYDVIDAPSMSPAAFRKMLSRLRQQLKFSGFEDVEAAIDRTQEGRTRLDHDKLVQSFQSSISAEN